MLIGTREHEVPDTFHVAGTPSTPQSATRQQAFAALNGPLKHFIGRMQRTVVMDNFRGEERQYFYDLMVELARRVEAMPKTYETEGQGKDAIVYLHYFAGGQANWYITEKDKGGPDDGPDGNHQQQATGQADLFGDGGEFGYISIEEILSCGGELDFHWTPKPLKEISHET